MQQRGSAENRNYCNIGVILGLSRVHIGIIGNILG